MSETVDSFNDKIEEIKADREKFDVLMDEFFGSADMNIKELLAEMMFHIIMTRGAELQEKFDDIDKMRKMFEDMDFGDMTYPGGGYQQWPNTIGVPGTITSPNSTGTWITTTDNITLQSDGTFEVEDTFIGNDPYTHVSSNVSSSTTSKIEIGDFGNVTFTNSVVQDPISEDDEPVIIPSIFTDIGNDVNVVSISDVKIQNIIDKYESVSEKEYSDDSFKSAINAIGSINWNAQTS